MLKKVAAMTLAVPLMAGGLCFAEEKMETKRTETTVDRTDATAAAGVNHARVSKFIGKDVHNAAGKDVGEIKDVVLDGNANRVSYAVVSYGGFMGMGDKLFAVPWNAFEFRFEGDKGDMTKESNRDDYKLYLAISDEQMKAAPGFDDKNWPNMADPKVREQVDKHYGRGVNTQMNNMPGKTEGVGDGGVIDRNAEKMAKTGPSDSKGLLWVRRASKAIGADVHNKANEDVGKITDLVADRTGKINYAVLSYGGVMGMGDKMFAVPMNALATKADDDKFVLDVTKDQLKNAPGFDKNSWPDFASADFQKNVNTFYKSGQTEAKTPMD